MRLPRSRHLLVAALCACCALSSAWAQGNSLNKTNGNGKWKDTGSWENDGGGTPENVPGPSDRAIINSGVLQISGNESVGELRLGGGDLTGYDESIDLEPVVDDVLTLIGGSFDSEWTGGTIDDLTLVVGTGATLNINHSTAGTLSNAVLETQDDATVNWLSGDILLNNASVINNAGTWNAVVDARIRHSSGSIGTFNNLSTGIFRKQGSLGSGFDDIFNNDGALFVEDGFLIIDGGGTMSASGTINVASGASIYFSQSYSIADAGGLSGSGLYLLSSGTLTLDGIATVTFRMDGGALTGDHTFANGFQWNGGEIKNGSTLNDLTSSFEINDAAGNTLTGHSFTNQGTVYWNDGDILLNAGTTFTNRGTLEDNAADPGETHSVRTSSGATGSFLNESGATYTLAGGGTSKFAVAFENQGAVALHDGSTLVLDGTGTNRNGASLTANTGTTVVFDNDFVVEEALDLLGGGQFTLAAGTLTMNGTVNAPDFTIDGGTLVGINSFNAGLVWNGGILGSAGTTHNTGDSAMSINDPSGNTLDNHHLINNGQVTWNDGDILLNNGSSITNDGSWNDQATDSGETHKIRTSAGTDAYFSNQNTYTKDSAGTTEIAVDFYNDGAVVVNNGTLILSGNGTASSLATFDVANGAALRFTADYAITDAVGLLGDGLVALDSGTLTLDGFVSSPDFAINGGILTGSHTFLNGANWNGGTLQDGSTYNQPNSVFAINDASGNTLNNHFLDSSHVIAWNDGDILLNNGSWISNQADFDDTAAGVGESHRIRTSSGSGAQFVNYLGASYNKDSDGETILDVTFLNDGTLNVNSGRLVLAGGGSTYTGGTLFVDGGSELAFTNDYEIGDASSLTGSGQVLLEAGTLSLNGTVNVPDFTINGGNLNGTITFANGASWNGGNLQFAALTNDTESLFTINDPSGNTLVGTFFTNNGEVEWTDGDLLLNTSTSVFNHGTWTDTAAGAGETHKIRVSSGSPTSYSNTGTYEKNGEGTTEFAVQLFNDGLIDVQSGTLLLSGAGSTSSVGSFNVASGAELVFNNDYDFTNGMSLTGSGLVKLQQGLVSIFGDIAVPNFTLTGGTLVGLHTFHADATLSGGALGDGSSFGTTTNAVGSTFFFDATTNQINAQLFNNDGEVQWLSGDFLLNNLGGINNDGTWIEQTNSDQRIRSSFGTPGIFLNDETGVFEKRGTGLTTFDVALTNHGTIEIYDGDLAFNDGGHVGPTGSIDVAAGSQVTYGSTFNVDTGAVLSGEGDHVANGSSFTLNADVDGNFVLASGTLDGTQQINGTLTIEGGKVGEGGTTTIAPSGSLVLAHGSGNVFSDRTVDNQGSASLVDGDLNLDNGSIFENSGTLDFDPNLTAADFAIRTNTGSMGYLKNLAAGTIWHRGDGTVSIYVPFESDGDFFTNSGRVILLGGGAFGADAVIAGTTGGEFVFNSDTSLVDLGTLQGNGTFRVEGGTLDAPGTLDAELIVDGGMLHGDVAVAGILEFATDGFEFGHSLDVANSGLLILDAASGLSLDGTGLTIASGGAMDWLSGDLTLGLSNSLANQGTITVNALFANLAYADFASLAGLSNGLTVSALSAVPTFSNDGTLQLSANTGSFAIRVPFTNTGTIDLQGGQLSLYENSTFDASSDILLGADTEFRVDAGTTSISDAGIFSGDGALVQLGGQLNLNGRLEVDLHLIEGHLNTTALTLSREFRLDDATLSSGATIDLVDGANGRLNPVSLDFGTTLFSVDASSQLTWRGGSLFANAGGGFNIAGLMFAESDDAFGSATGTPGAFTLQKTGQFRKTGGTGTTAFDVPVTIDGRFEVHTGSVDFNAPGTSDGGTFDLWAGTTLNLNHDFTFGDGTVVSNGGSLVLDGGTYTIDGAVTFGPAAQFRSGTYTGTHTLSGNITWLGGEFDANGTTTIGEDGLLALATAQTYHLNRDFTVDGQLALQGSDLTGSGVTLTNNGAFFIVSDSTVSSATNDFDIQNNGVIGKVAGSGTATIDVPVTNAGTVFSGSGILHFADTFTFDGGSIGVANGGQVTFAAPLALPKSTVLAGNGTITADISTGGTVSPGASVGSLTIDGDLTLLSGASSFFEIDEVSAGVLSADLTTVTGTLTLAGDLELSFLTTLDPISTDMFTLYTANNLLGQFDNVANGGQLWTHVDGGMGGFTVNYGASSLFDPNSVILSNFEFTPVPEPSTWALMITGLGIVVVQLYRRRRAA